MSSYTKPKNVTLYHPTHGSTISISDELKFRSCPRCKADDRYGNELLSKKCPNLREEFLRPGELDAPEGKVSKVIFQIDGILADPSHRSEFAEKNIEAYNDACFEDVPIEPILHLMHNLVESKFYTVEIWSLRPESVRDLTELWLDKAGINLKRLRLRMAPTDKRDDAVAYYSSIFEESIDPPSLAYFSNISFVKWMKEQGVCVMSQ